MDFENAKELVEHLRSKAMSKISSVKAFDLSTLYATIPHEQFKYRLICGIIRSTILSLVIMVHEDKVCSPEEQHCMMKVNSK